MIRNLIRRKGINQTLLYVILTILFVGAFLLSLYAAMWVSWGIGKPVTPEVLLKRNSELIFPVLFVIALRRLIARALGKRKRCNVSGGVSGQRSDMEQRSPSGANRPCQTFDDDLDRLCSRCLTAAQTLDKLKMHPDLKAQLLSFSAECSVASVLLSADPKRDSRAKVAIQNGEDALREFKSAYFGSSVPDQYADIDRTETLLNTFNAAQKRKYARIMIRFYRRLAVIRCALAATSFSLGERPNSPDGAKAGLDYDRLMHDHELEITSFFQHLVYGNDLVVQD